MCVPTTDLNFVMRQDGDEIQVDVRSGRESNKFVERLEANFEVTWPSLAKVGLCLPLDKSLSRG